MTGGLPLALLVEVALLALALRGAVIGDTSDRRLPLAVSFPAAESATQVLPTTITRVREEKDAAMPAPDQASSWERLGS